MSTYSTGQFPNSGATGKRYGARGIGGTVGEFIQDGSQREAIFELKAGEPMAAARLTKSLPAGYRVDGISYEVATLFNGTTPSFTVTVGGGTASSANSVATAIAATAYTAGAITNLSGVAAANLVITPNAGAIASTAGTATIVVKYTVI